MRNVRNDVVQQAKTVGHDQVPAIYDQTLGEFYFKAGTQVANLEPTPAPNSTSSNASVSTRIQSDAVEVGRIGQDIKGKIFQFFSEERINMNVLPATFPKGCVGKRNHTWKVSFSDNLESNYVHWQTHYTYMPYEGAEMDNSYEKIQVMRQQCSDHNLSEHVKLSFLPSWGKDQYFRIVESDVIYCGIVRGPTTNCSVGANVVGRLDLLGSKEIKLHLLYRDMILKLN